MSNTEQTLSIIKPDAIERNLTEEIKSIFLKIIYQFYKQKNFKFQKMKLQNFIKFINQNLFYEKLCNYLYIGPIEVMILQGENAVLKNRELMGATDPKNAERGNN